MPYAFLCIDDKYHGCDILVLKKILSFFHESFLLYEFIGTVLCVCNTVLLSYCYSLGHWLMSELVRQMMWYGHRMLIM